MSETSEFLKDLEKDSVQDTFERPLTEIPAEELESAEQAEQKLKNRRERRLADKLQSEREANIALNARLQAISESKTLRETTEEADYLKRIEKIYGTATPEGKEATELFKEALKGAVSSAKQAAVEELRSERTKETQEVREEENNLDSILEQVEDEHGIDMSSDADRKGFLTLLERISPKDRDGNIIEFADPDTVAEVYLSRKERVNGRAKELASRSMTRSGASQPSKLEQDATWKFLREHGF